MLDLPIVAAFRPAPAVTLGHGHCAVQAPARGCRAGRAAQRHRTFALLLLARGGLIGNIQPCFSFFCCRALRYMPASLSSASRANTCRARARSALMLTTPARDSTTVRPSAANSPSIWPRRTPRSPALMRDTWLASQPMASPTTSFLTAARRRRISSRTSVMRVIPYASPRTVRHANMLAPPMTAAEIACKPIGPAAKKSPAPSTDAGGNSGANHQGENRNAQDQAIPCATASIPVRTPPAGVGAPLALAALSDSLFAPGPDAGRGLGLGLGVGSWAVTLPRR